MRRWLTIAPVLLAGACTQAVEYKVTVKAGKHHRVDTPVSIVLAVPDNMATATGTATCGDLTVPVQVAKFGTATARAWWVVPDLLAGQSKTFTLKIGPGACPASTKVFKWTDSSEGKIKSMDLLFGDRPVLRYMYTPFDRRNMELTKKPFHNVFAPDGSRLITQSVGGKKYPHHRGIYFGYNKCTVDGGTYDVWHAHKGEHQVHTKVILEVTGPVVGGHVVQIHWNDRKGKPFVEETRSLFAYRQSAGNLLIEFTSTLKPTRGPVKLGGDRQHAGAQFRAHGAVAQNEKATRYLRPTRWAQLAPDKQYNTPEHKDLPWNAIQFSLGDQGYTVGYLTDPKNPANAGFSERLYGRFGEFFPWDLRQDNPLNVRYRWWISATRSVKREQVEQRYQDLADAPELTLE